MRLKIKWIGFIALALSFFVPNVFAGKVAIVIDDIGYKKSDRQLLNLNAALTFAVLPHTPLGAEYAKLAAQNKRDVIIHLPMQARQHNRLLGPGALLTDMTKQQYQQTLISALEDIPYAVGVNNHMGSLLTQMEQPMAWTMELLRQHNMFFLDSKTTKHSKIESVASEWGVNALHRNIFLDHHRDKKQIRKQFKRLINIAKNYGMAIGIGHPYGETYEVLQEQIGELEAAGIELVPLSSLLPTSPVIQFAGQRPDYQTQEPTISE
ncbi:divergent polysaccharide deacetylase family protein [Psychrosphaera haliotis]|uniref:divergent polysaccharide deacetylase family protein n=1 Tax=Psychrosphaera haliotis TaxID=555083 RepID=UPI002ED890FB